MNAVENQSMRAQERVLSFGSGGHLIGILTQGSAGQGGAGQDSSQAKARVAVLSWNVGINHHVGPYRIYVELARRLAEFGTASLRFDVSGLGDSEFGADDSRSENERALGDIQSAMAEVTRHTGIDQFVLVGFCSSVDAAHQLALIDERVVGLVYLEGYSYETPGYFARYPLRFLSLDRWARLLYRKAPGIFGAAKEPVAEREAIFVRDYPSREKFSQDLKALDARGVRSLFIYVSGDSGYEYERQLEEIIGQANLPLRVEREFLRHSDHTFSVPEDRAFLLTRVIRFVQSHFGS